MMRGLFLLLLCLITLPALASSGQKSAPALLDPKDEKPLTASELSTYFKDCKYNIPRRFTPDAREHFCGCTALKLKDEKFRPSELKAMSQPKNFVITNKTFERYASRVVAPCLDMPTEQIEYLTCVLDSSIDPRINYIPGYCTCVARKMKAHVRKNAAADILLSFGTKNFVYSDPMDAMWNNSNYLKTLNKAQKTCITGG